ncbi:MAG: ATP-binding protein [Desulfomonile sp.]
MSQKYFEKLGLKIIAVTLGFSLIPLFALGATIYYQFNSTFQNKMIESLRNLAQNRKSSLELFIDERISQLNTIAQTHSFEKLADEQFLTKVFNAMQSRSKSFIDLGIIDSDGNHLAYVGPYHDKLMSVNYAHEDWFHAVQSTGAYVSDVFLGFRKAPHFIIAVTTVQNNRVWILRATINSAIIDEIVAGAQIGKRGDAFIVNRGNILQTAPRFSGKLLTHPSSPDFSSSRGLIVETVSFQGNETLYAAVPIVNPNWVLVVSEDPQEEMALLFRAHYIEAVILAFGVFLVIIGTVLTTRVMTRRLKEVEKEKSKSEDLIIQSSKMAALGKMAAGIAHEINNPLQIIGDQAGWMKDLLDSEDMKQTENFEEFEQCIKKIERQVNRSREITHRLLRFGRRMETTQELVDINQILMETLTFLENEAHFRDIQIQTNYDDNLPKVSTDPNQLQQVFLNIIDNAIDAVGQSGQIRVETFTDKQNHKQIMVKISDNGPGISRELISKIFDPFFTTKRPDEGTGLGLSISYGIMEKLGGHIAVESEEGKGTTFIISVPQGSSSM